MNCRAHIKQSRIEVRKVAPGMLHQARKRGRAAHGRTD